MTVHALIHEAQKLSPRERWELVDELLQMEEGDVLADVELTPPQREDLRRRIEESRSGRAVLIDGDEAFARLRNRT